MGCDDDSILGLRHNQAIFAENYEEKTMKLDLEQNGTGWRRCAMWWVKELAEGQNIKLRERREDMLLLRSGGLLYTGKE